MKRTFLLLVMIMCMLYPQPIHGEENLIAVKQEFVIYEDGIEVLIRDYLEYHGSGITVTREKIYGGIVIPDSSIGFTEIEDGVTYSGTLYLVSYRHTKSQTIAIYQGTLTAVN